MTAWTLYAVAAKRYSARWCQVYEVVVHRWGGRLTPVVADASASAGADRLIVVDPHTPSLEAVCRIPVETVTAVPALCAEIATTLADAVVVAPDLGAVKLAEQYASILHLPVAVVRKQRQTGSAVTALDVAGDVCGRSTLIVDDMITTAATIEAAARLLRQRGRCPTSALPPPTRCWSTPPVTGCTTWICGGFWSPTLVTDTVAVKNPEPTSRSARSLQSSPRPSPPCTTDRRRDPGEAPPTKSAPPAAVVNRAGSTPADTVYGRPASGRPLATADKCAPPRGYGLPNTTTTQSLCPRPIWETPCALRALPPNRLSRDSLGCRWWSRLGSPQRYSQQACTSRESESPDPTLLLAGRRARRAVLELAWCYLLTRIRRGCTATAIRRRPTEKPGLPRRNPMVLGTGPSSTNRDLSP